VARGRPGSEQPVGDACPRAGIYDHRAVQERLFVIAPYTADLSGLFQVARPLACPRGEGLKPGCQVVVHQRRRRATGIPWGWVAVLRCDAHDVAFTAYPPGHIPYGREPLIQLAPDGSSLIGGGPDARFSETPFAAALGLGDGPSRSTTSRRIRRSAALLGLVAKTLDYELAARVAHLPAGVVHEHAVRLEGVRSLRAWSTAVAALLGELRADRSQGLVDRFAILGHISGRWGRPHRWREGTTPRLLALGRPFLLPEQRQPRTSPSPENGPTSLTHSAAGNDLRRRGPPGPSFRSSRARATHRTERGTPSRSSLIGHPSHASHSGVWGRAPAPS